MRLVMKFGGSSLADGKRLLHVAEITAQMQQRGDEVVVVTSALGGVTDALINVAKKVSRVEDELKILEATIRLRDRHTQAARDAISDPAILNTVEDLITLRMDELEKALIGISHLGELTDRTLDYITSFGERLAAPILAGAITSLGSEARAFTGGEIGLITDENFQNATPLSFAERRIADTLMPVLGRYIPVVSGFIGETERGVITTLGRGGSDYSATIIGSAIDADEIWLWKDTSGIMTADPKIVPDARRIPVISYIEAMELSYFGAEVLHSRSMEPVIRKKIPIRVKNTFNPEDPGTLIVEKPEKVDEVVKAITVIRDCALVTISGFGMIGVPGVAAEVFSALARKNVNIMMISQGSSERAISILVDGKDLKKAISALESCFPSIKKEIVYRDDVSALAVVGAGMAGTPGVAGRVFSALGKNMINVIMISQGSSEYNISMVVSDSDIERAVRVIHDEFGLGEEG
ncbi:MAG TPA: aspartate kinase [Candidatus Syntrophoarchaeum butanivorans]|uniref:Aspartokinase n=1 Tax=Candidatus Syntropharchaeum butanivorans TaxID=1839936 RepID=A0A1F2P5F0_9EURY|nr:MAG: Aspartokinase [Candidatus Syntrophoarchaeum butanivorans]HEC57284.1 aspartate kinase [Candidatus Syntrophoarchaeum butanivorans]